MGTPGHAGLILVNLLGCLLVLGDGARSGDFSWCFFGALMLRYLHEPMELSCRGVGYWIPRVGLLGGKPRAWGGTVILTLCLTASTAK